MVLRLACGLREAGLEPTIATLRAGWLTDGARAASLPVWLAPQQPGLDPAWVPRFARRLRRERIDVVHSHEFAMNVYAGAAARLAGLAALATVHGAHWVADRTVRRIAYRVLCRVGMDLAAVSSDLADFLARSLAVPRTEIHVVPNGVPLPRPRSRDERARERARLRAELAIPPERPLLLAVGNLYPVKDHATLLRASAGLEGVHVLVAGRGPELESLASLARALGAASRVHLLGLRGDVDRLLAASDLLVHPSRAEGLPLAILEAMAAALPVVATRVGGIPEAVLEGETGLLVRPGDPEGLRDAIRNVLHDPDRAALLGRAGRARVEEHFSIEGMTRRYRALYEAARGSDR
jgi:glycosyltransferase involved in cell wall biosynthesis